MDPRSFDRLQQQYHLHLLYEHLATQVKLHETEEELKAKEVFNDLMKRLKN